MMFVPVGGRGLLRLSESDARQQRANAEDQIQTASVLRKIIFERPDRAAESKGAGGADENDMKCFKRHGIGSINYPLPP